MRLCTQIYSTIDTAPCTTPTISLFFFFGHSQPPPLWQSHSNEARCWLIVVDLLHVWTTWWGCTHLYEKKKQTALFMPTLTPMWLYGTSQHSLHLSVNVHGSVTCKRVIVAYDHIGNPMSQMLLQICDIFTSTATHDQGIKVFAFSWEIQNPCKLCNCSSFAIQDAVCSVAHWLKSALISEYFSLDTPNTVVHLEHQEGKLYVSSIHRSQDSSRR